MEQTSTKTKTDDIGSKIPDLISWFQIKLQYYIKLFQSSNAPIKIISRII